jgi:membrane protease YdiL (CAAX protease family)
LSPGIAKKGNIGLLSNPKLLQPILFVYLAFAFALLVTVFHYKRRIKAANDFRAVLLYFVSFFLALLVVPILIICLASAAPGQLLLSLGWTVGRSRRGILLMVIAIPIAIASAYVASKDPVMRQQYPLSKQACSSLKKFVLYEMAYLVLYYLPWEFVFRGLLFFSLLSSSGLLMSLAVQTIVSTLYHIGHPDSEIFAALGSGFIFGLIAYSTGSFLYTLFIHALVGICNDALIFHRYYRRQGP